MNNLLNLDLQYFAEDTGTQTFENGGADESGDSLDSLFYFEESDTGEEDGEEDTGTQTDEQGTDNSYTGKSTETAKNANIPDNEPMYTVKYNGVEQQLPVSQLTTYAQKGMNYDKILQERDALRQSPAIAYIESLAKKNGISQGELIEKLTEIERQRQISEQVSRGVPQETAERLLQLEEKEHKQAEKAAADNAKEQQKQQFDEFVKAYPDVKELPDEVLEKIIGGETPKSAYVQYENKQLKAELAAIRKNAENRQNNIGSIASEDGADNADTFLTAFCSAL